MKNKKHLCLENHRCPFFFILFLFFLTIRPSSDISNFVRHIQEDSSESIYKSEILFSPVREVPMVSFSIDSLDCEEPDIMLTCQANKDNYTIAFEGSTLMEKSVETHCQNSNNNEVLNDISEEGKWSLHLLLFGTRRTGL